MKDFASVLDKIAKLHLQAERTDNPDEAQAFYAHAQLLASRYSIDLAMARAHALNKEKRETPTHRTITLGRSGQKNNAALVQLFLTIARANDVKCNIAHNSTFVIAFGFPSDIDLAETLYVNISTQMVEQANKVLKKGDYKTETREVWSDKDWCYVTKPMDGRVVRRNFYESFTNQIGLRLNEARRQAQVQVEAERVETDDAATESGEPGVALVLAAKTEEVNDYYTKASTAKGSWRGGSYNGGYSAFGANAGAKAGQSANIGGERAIRGGHKEIG